MHKRTAQLLQTYPWLITIGLILLIMAFHLRGMHSMYMWADEHLSYENTRYPLDETLNRLFTANNHPPLWYSNFWLWRRLVGTHEITGRMQSILFSAISISLIYQLGKTWFGKPRYGWFAAAVLGSSVLFFIYSLEIRQYALTMLAAALSMWLYTLWLKRSRWRYAVLYGASVALMLYVHYFLAFIAIVQAIHYLIFQLRSWDKLKNGVIAAVSAVVLWLPWLPILMQQLDFVRRDAEAKGRVGGLASTTYPTSPDVIEDLIELATHDQLWLYAVLIVLGALFLWRNSRYWLAVLWALAVPALVFLVNAEVRVYTPRYVAVLILGLALTLGAALAALPRYIRWLALAGVIALNLYTLPTFIPVRAPERDILQAISTLSTPDDAVYFTEGTASSQVPRYLAPALQANTVDDLTAATDAPRIWFITERWQDDSVRGMFRQLEETHALQTVLGQCKPEWCYLAQLLEAPPYDEPLIFGDEIAFWGGDVDAVTANRIETRLWWRVRQSPAQDYSIGLHLVDATGQVVAQNDGALYDFYAQAELQTSQLQPDTRYIDVRSLELPPDLAAGEYQLVVLVYQWWDGVRLQTSDGRDEILLQTVTIP